MSDKETLERMNAELERIEAVMRERGPVLSESISRKLGKETSEQLAEINRYRDMRGEILDLVARYDMWLELARKITFHYDQELGRRAALEDQLAQIRKLPSTAEADPTGDT